MNTDALDRLCRDLNAPELRAALNAMEIEATSNVHARAFLGAVCWIAEQPGRTPVEKFDAIGMLLKLPKGFVHIESARQFFGWDVEDDEPHERRSN